MTKAEIKFLLDAGFSVEEIQGMSAGQNAVNTAPALSAATPAEPVKPAEPAPVEPAAPAPALSTPAPAAPSPVAGDFTPMIEKLDKILGAIQSANRSAASVTTSTPMTPEEIAGQLIK